jgi:hypothetical protein
MDVLRHGAMGELFDGIRAPSTLGSFLRSFTWGNVRQAEKVSRLVLAQLAARTPLLPGAGQLAFVDMDSSQRRVYEHKKQGAAFGHTKIQGKTVLVRGLNALVAAVSAPGSAPLVAATRLRRGTANTARGAASLLAEAIGAARDAGATGIIIARMDSGYHNASVIGAALSAGAYFSVTARLDPAVKAAIASVPGDAWTAIKYPQAIWDEQLGCWASDAEVAENRIHGVHLEEGPAGDRPADRAPGPRPEPQDPRRGRAVPVWRYHPVFTNSPFILVQAEAQHRDHAVVEQFSRTGPPGRWATCPQASSPPMLPGSPWPASRTTCCALPARSPRRSTQKHAAQSSARS